MALVTSGVLDLVSGAKKKKLIDHPNPSGNHTASGSAQPGTAESGEDANVGGQFQSPMPSTASSGEREHIAAMEEVQPIGERADGWEPQDREPRVLPHPATWTFKQHVYVLLEEESAALLYPKLQPPLLAKIVSHLLLYTIIASIACFVLETDPTLKDFWLWKVAEPVTTVIFTIEYVGRFFVCDAFGTQTRCGFVKAPMNVLDLMAILPYYFEVAAEELMKSFKPLRVLRSVRLIRCFRILKLSKYNSGMQMMIESLVNSLQPLSILIFFLAIGVMLFSSLMYFAEKMSCPDVAAMLEKGTFTKHQDECNALQTGWDSNGYLCCNRYGSSQDFESIATTFWWSIVTMTTVGYGDLSPKTFYGRCVGAAAMLSGIILISLPVAIVGSKFQQAYESQEERKAQEALKAEEEREIEESKRGSTQNTTKRHQSLGKVMNLVKAEATMAQLAQQKQATREAEQIRQRRDERGDAGSPTPEEKEKLKDSKAVEAMIHFDGLRTRLKKLTNANLSQHGFEQVELLLELFDHIERVEMQLTAMRKKDTVLDNCIRKEFVSLSRAYDSHVRSAGLAR